MQSLSDKYLPLLFTGLIIAFSLLSCAPGDDPTEPDPPVPTRLSGTLGAGGGILVSNDGKMTLTVPAGALAADTDIIIAEIGSDEADSKFDGFAISKAFSVEPDGLEFSSAVELSLTMDVETPTSKYDEETPLSVSPIIVLDLAPSDRELHLPDLAIHADLPNNGVTIRGETEFIRPFIIGQPIGEGRPIMSLGAGVTITGPVVVNQSRQAVVKLEISEGLSVDLGSFAFDEDESSTFDFSIADGISIVPDFSVDNPDGSIDFTFLPAFRATESGTQSFNYGMTFSVSPTLSTLDDLDINVDPIPKFSFDVDYPTLPVLVQPSTTGNTSPAIGVYETELPLSEGLTVIVGLADWILDYTLGVANGNGLTFLDITSEPAMQVANDSFAANGNQYYGSVVMKYQFKDGKEAGYEILLIGPEGGAISGWNSASNDFGMMQIFGFGQNLTDALAYGNNMNSEGYCYVNNTSNHVRLMKYSSESGYFISDGNLLSFPEAPGKVISAFVREAGSVLVATEGTPGRLYLHDRSDFMEDPVAVATLGNSPRRIRSLNNVAAVSNFASGTLSIISWSQGDAIAVTATVSVGDGPVGLDLLELDAGNIGIVSTGFNDNSYWVTVVSATGTLVSNTEYSMPAGITGPGHAVWLQDENKRIAITGNTTGNLAVVASGL